MKSIYYTYMDSPVGKLLLAGEESGLMCIGFQEGKGVRRPEREWMWKEVPFLETIRQLRDYFEGKRRGFDLPLVPEGTPFQLQVWKALRDIPYGATVSYAEIARRIGKPKAVRAVGSANGRNPLPIIVPCHRVIGSNGSLTGYGGGIAIKELLLRLERRHSNSSGCKTRPLFADARSNLRTG